VHAWVLMNNHYHLMVETPEVAWCRGWGGCRTPIPSGIIAGTGCGAGFKDKRDVEVISDALQFGRLWYVEPNAISSAVGCAKHRSRSHDPPVRI
jgi:hypothetical protein